MPVGLPSYLSVGSSAPEAYPRRLCWKAFWTGAAKRAERVAVERNEGAAERRAREKVREAIVGGGEDGELRRVRRKKKSESQSTRRQRVRPESLKDNWQWISRRDGERAKVEPRANRLPHDTHAHLDCSAYGIRPCVRQEKKDR
jgi:hypothetical protein